MGRRGAERGGNEVWSLGGGQGLSPKMLLRGVFSPALCIAAALGTGGLSRAQRCDSIG